MKWTAMNADPMSTSFLAPFRNMTQISTNFELLYVGNFRIEFWGPCKKMRPKKAMWNVELARLGSGNGNGEFRKLDIETLFYLQRIDRSLKDSSRGCYIMRKNPSSIFLWIFKRVITIVFILTLP